MRSPNPLMAALQNKTPSNSILYPLPYTTFLALTVINWLFRGLFFLQLRESVCIHFTKIKNLISYFTDFKWSVTILFTRKWRITSLAIPADIEKSPTHVLVNPAQKIKFCATWKLRNFSYVLNYIFIFLNFQRYDLFSTSLQSCRYWLRLFKGMYSSEDGFQFCEGCCKCLGVCFCCCLECPGKCGDCLELLQCCIDILKCITCDCD